MAPDGNRGLLRGLLRDPSVSERRGLRGLRGLRVLVLHQRELRRRVEVARVPEDSGGTQSPLNELDVSTRVRGARPVVRDLRTRPVGVHDAGLLVVLGEELLRGAEVALELHLVARTGVRGEYVPHFGAERDSVRLLGEAVTVVEEELALRHYHLVVARFTVARRRSLVVTDAAVGIELEFHRIAFLVVPGFRCSRRSPGSVPSAEVFFGFRVGRRGGSRLDWNWNGCLFSGRKKTGSPAGTAGHLTTRLVVTPRVEAEYFSLRLGVDHGLRIGLLFLELQYSSSMTSSDGSRQGPPGWLDGHTSQFL